MNTKAINAMIQTHKLSCITRRKGNFVCSCGRDQAEIELAAIQTRIDTLEAGIRRIINGEYDNARIIDAAEKFARELLHGDK